MKQEVSFYQSDYRNLSQHGFTSITLVYTQASKKISAYYQLCNDGVKLPRTKLLDAYICIKVTTLRFPAAMTFMVGGGASVSVYRYARSVVQFLIRVQ
jgi:hypothetical protein